jgi:hypothetical protein
MSFSSSQMIFRPLLEEIDARQAIGADSLIEQV